MPAKKKEEKRIQLEYIPIDKLHGWDRNPRKMTEEEHAQLQKSIEHFGLVEPIVINKDNRITGGHQRVEDAATLGIKTIPCVRLNLPPRKWKALNLVLNRIHGD